MFVKQSWLIIFMFSVSFLPNSGLSEDRNNKILIKLPEELVHLGFDKFLFSRFKFRSQISIVHPTTEKVIHAELGVTDSGSEVFSDLNGVVYRLKVQTKNPLVKDKLHKFQLWLTEGPGSQVIEDFSYDGMPLFAKLPQIVEEIEEVEFIGDVRKGKTIAVLHCKRCHVVDSDVYSGIGSTPSFHAMKSSSRWVERFSAFWTENPHVSIISVEDLFDAGGDSSPVPIAPVNLKLEDIDDILAYVDSIQAKDLGLPVGSW